MLPIRTILHPTDFSEFSEAAFHLACSMAKDYGAELVLLHVHQPSPVIYGELGASPPLYGEEMEEMRARLFAIEPDDPSISVDYHFVQGDAVREILHWAEERHCDLIVMGTHGRSGLARLLMGSVAEQIMRRAECPVVTVKATVREPMAVA